MPVVFATAMVLAALPWFTAPAQAAPVTYTVSDHPDGGAAPPTYMLRLNNTETFTADALGTGVSFSFDAANPGQATLQGTIQHNQGGMGFYTISATFQTVLFTDGGASVWHGANPTNAVYDDMLADLLNNSDATDSNDTSFRSDLDRVYFQFVDMTLALSSGANSYGGQLVWDEYPNAPSTKKFFIQKNHRTNADVLAGAGWLEEAPDTGNRVVPSDFLFLLTKAATPDCGTPGGPPCEVPEPGALALLGFGLVGLFAVRRRRGKS